MEQRRKEALQQTADDGSPVAESSLQQLIGRYRFLDLWPCSSFDLDHMAHQQVLFEFFLQERMDEYFFEYECTCGCRVNLLEGR